MFKNIISFCLCTQTNITLHPITRRKRFKDNKLLKGKRFMVTFKIAVLVGIVLATAVLSTVEVIKTNMKANR